MDIDGLLDLRGTYVVPIFVHLALSVLVQSLNHYRFIYGKRENQLDGVYFPIRCRPFNFKLLNDQGWCPNMIERIYSSLGLEVQYYATLLPGFGLGKAHEKYQESACVASNIDHDKYEVIHVPNYCRCRDMNCEHRRSECRCPYIGIQETDVVTAFEGGGFPLVNFHHDRITTVSYEPGIDYVAISHVWSDGRGNPRENALPQCQLQAIYSYVGSLASSSDSLFWIDTLCVPLQEPLRNTAIMRMAEVYSSASVVLVLSADLLSHKLPSSPDEASFRIFYSQWAARLWTFQEAILADELVFQFADRAINYSTLKKQVRRANFSVGEFSRQFGSMACFHIGLMKRRLHVHGNLPIIRFWQGLHSRTTSRLSDVAICGSILLGYGLETILSVPDQEKMRVFWSCQNLVPVGVLWTGKSRFRTDGLRWAPSNLLEQETSTRPPHMVDISAKPTIEGLLVSGVDAVRLEHVPLPDSELVIFRFLLPGTQQRYFCIKDPNAENETWAELQSFWNGRCVLLMSQIFNQRGLAALTVPTNVTAADDSAQQDTKPIRLRYIARAWVLLEGHSLEGEKFEAKDGFAALRSLLQNSVIPILDIADSKFVQPSQMLCIF